MRDGQTRKLRKVAEGAEMFFRRHMAVLVMLRGGAEGSEFELDRERVTLGRGSEADLRFEDEGMSALHMAFETTSDEMMLKDLGSTNGVCLNGSPVREAVLKHGDRIEAGEHEFQLILEDRDPPTQIIRFPEDA